MPYIKQEDRPKFQEDLQSIYERIDGLVANHVEDLECVTKIASIIVDRWFNHKPSYQTINDICGVFNCVFLEYERRNGFNELIPSAEVFFPSDDPEVKHMLRDLEEPVESLANKLEENDYSVGEVNYVLSTILEITTHVEPLPISDVGSVINHIVIRFYENKATPYELKKIEENGDI